MTHLSATGISDSAVTEPTPNALQSDSSLKTHADEIADHVAEARDRARHVLGGEAHLGSIDDWRQAIVTARDGVIVIWVTWVALLGFGAVEHAGPILVSAGLGISIFLGIAKGLATRAQVRYYESELERERREIREDPEHEREEVRTLYAAKGFQEPLLTQIADTLCADDDRLLKVMMEEELGLFTRHVNHPLLVGLWNTAGAMIATLLLAVPVCFRSGASSQLWMPAGGAVILVVAAIAHARAGRREIAPLATAWLVTALICGGVTYFMAALLAGR